MGQPVYIRYYRGTEDLVLLATWVRQDTGKELFECVDASDAKTRTIGGWGGGYMEADFEETLRNFQNNAKEKGEKKSWNRGGSSF